MKRLVVTAVVISAVSALFWGCASDIILPPKPSLKGTYTGEYRVVRNSGQPNEQEFKQDIDWTFDDQSFHLRMDTASATYGTHCFCQPNGQYVLADKVRLRITSGANIPSGGPCTACAADENPEGDFTLIYKGDTLDLILLDGADLKELVLVPAH